MDAGSADGAADGAATSAQARTAQVWTWLAEVSDPEIPVISIVDLGIVRGVDWAGAQCVVTITPTYSGCPAMQVIADAVTDALHAHGVADVRLVNQLSPAWTTDAMSEAGKRALHGYGIAPPAQQVIDISDLRGGVKVASAQISATWARKSARSASAAGATPCATIAASAAS